MLVFLSDSLPHLQFVHRTLNEAFGKHPNAVAHLFLIDIEEEKIKDAGETAKSLIARKIDTLGDKISSQESAGLTNDERLELIKELALSWDGYRKIISTAENIARQLQENLLQMEKLRKLLANRSGGKNHQSYLLDFEKRFEERQKLTAMIDMPEADFLEFFKQLHSVSERAHALRSDLVNHNLRLVVSIARK